MEITASDGYGHWVSRAMSGLPTGPYSVRYYTEQHSVGATAPLTGSRRQGRHIMATRIGVFNQPPPRSHWRTGMVAHRRYEGILFNSASGDALGWLTAPTRRQTRCPLM